MRKLGEDNMRKLEEEIMRKAKKAHEETEEGKGIKRKLNERGKEFKMREAKEENIEGRQRKTT